MVLRVVDRERRMLRIVTFLIFLRVIAGLGLFYVGLGAVLSRK